MSPGGCSLSPRIPAEDPRAHSGSVRVSKDPQTERRGLRPDLGATRGIVARSFSATSELRSIMLEVVDDMSEVHIGSQLSVYIDDVNIGTDGEFYGDDGSAEKGKEELEKRHSAAIDGLVGRLGTYGLDVAEDKSCTIGGGRASAGNTTKLVAKSSARYLGVGAGGGSRRTTKVMKERLRSFKAKKRRFGVLKRAKVNVYRVARASRPRTSSSWL